MFGKKNYDNLSVEELEKMVRVKRRQSRVERFQRLSGDGHSVNESLMGGEARPEQDGWTFQSMIPTFSLPRLTLGPRRELSQPKQLIDRILLGLEVAAVMGLVMVLVGSYFSLRELNAEVAEAQNNSLLSASPTAPVPPPIALTHLPGGHTPPTAPGGAVPDVPLHLQNWVQPTAVADTSITIERQPHAPTRIVIPKIDVNAPIVEGVSWEDLKKGVGHLPGSANPGERGNLYLAAHNDIYGEIFRYLEKLNVGDEYYIYAGEQRFHYRVKEKRIIEPTQVEVMLPTTEPVATLQTCYPYLINTHRLVVIGELVE